MARALPGTASGSARESDFLPSLGTNLGQTPNEQPGSDPSLCAETPAGLMRDEHNKYQAGASEQDRFKREDNQGNANTFRDFHGASFRDVATLIIA